MENIDKRISQAEKEFEATIAEITDSRDTMLNRSLLNVAIKQNDLIFILKKKRDNGR